MATLTIECEFDADSDLGGFCSLLYLYPLEQCLVERASGKVNECLHVFCSGDASLPYFYSCTPPKAFAAHTGRGQWPVSSTHNTLFFYYHNPHIMLFASFLQSCAVSV